MTPSAMWIWLTRGPQVPYVPVQAYRYRKGMQKAAAMYQAVDGKQAKATAVKVKALLAADRQTEIKATGRVRTFGRRA